MKKAVPVKPSATTSAPRSLKCAPRVKRNFAKVDVAYFREDEEEDGVNPDWLIGAY
jgi:hypothetical protein